MTSNRITESSSLLFAVSVYVVCALVGPRMPDEGTIDLEDFFWRQRIYFYGAIIACLILALLANLDFLKRSAVAETTARQKSIDAWRYSRLHLRHEI